MDDNPNKNLPKAIVVHPNIFQVKDSLHPFNMPLLSI